MKKVILVLLAVMFLSSSAWAGTIPEFDAVGCDVLNVFAKYNSIQYAQLIAYNKGPYGPINYFGLFPEEYFHQSAGQGFKDPCFGPYGLISHLTDVYNEGVYEWYIVLQMKPASDLNVNIHDCVLDHNKFTPWGWAQQTGRYTSGQSGSVFDVTANPSITVIAYPGPNATPNFIAPFIMDARTLPGLDTVALDDTLYTSKGIWSEGLVVVMPETGKTNASGQTTYDLKQGDKIYVRIAIPYNSTCDIRYGADSVIVKYLGIVGTWWYGTRCGS